MDVPFLRRERHSARTLREACGCHRCERDCRQRKNSNAAASPTAFAGIMRLSPEAMREIEPHVKGVAGAARAGNRHRELQSRARKCIRRKITEAGSSVRTDARSSSVALANQIHSLPETTAGPIRTKTARQLCRACIPTALHGFAAIEPGVRIVPFRGEYYELKPHAATPLQASHLPCA